MSKEIDLLSMIDIPNDRLEEQMKWINFLGVELINYMKEEILNNWLFDIPKEYFNHFSLNKFLTNVDNINCSISEQPKKVILKELYKILYKLGGYVE